MGDSNLRCRRPFARPLAVGFALAIAGSLVGANPPHAAAQESPITGPIAGEKPARGAVIDASDANGGIDPALVKLADAPAPTAPTAPTTEDAGPNARDDAADRVLVEADANGMFTVWVDGEQRRPIAEISADLRTRVQSAFPLATLVPSTSRTRLRIWISPAEIRALHALLVADLPDVTLAPPVQPVPTFAAVQSQGVAAMEANAMHTAGVTGSGVSVAVIDSSFATADTTAAAEVGTFSRHPTQSSFASDSSPHGTACAELLRDVAPAASLTLLRVDAGLDIETATTFALDSGAQIITSSLAFFGFPGNGASCDAARDAIANGATWVNSSGNFAAGNYWETNASDFGANAFLDFQPGTEFNQITPTASAMQVAFSYERPDASFTDMRAEIIEENGGQFFLIAQGSGATLQNFAVNVVAGRNYFVRVGRATVATNGRLRIQVFNGTMAVQTATGSIANPATLADVVTVGAVTSGDYAAAGSVAAYSSRGGGVFNLDVDCCGPTDCLTQSFGTFSGTSAAAPHVAGLLALYRSHPALAFDSLNHFAFDDLSPAGFDTAAGKGAANARASLFTATGDSFEPDNSTAQATALGGTSTTSGPHAIDPATDGDWFRFNLTAASAVTIATIGPGSGDTWLSLRDATTAEIASDDNNGGGKWSRIVKANLPAGQYFIRVTETGADEIIAGYSLVLGVGAVGSTPPESVTVQNPPDGTLGRAATTNFSWTATTGASPITYEFQLSLNPTFATTVHAAAGLTGTTRSVSGMPSDSTLYWRVRGRNRLGDGPWSSTRVFTTATPVGTPVITSPAADATNVPTATQLRWGVPAGTSPVTFSVQVATDASFNSMVVNQTGITSNFLPVDSLATNTFYFWRVRAQNALGIGDFCATVQFLTAPTPTTVPTQLGGGDTGCGAGASVCDGAGASAGGNGLLGWLLILLIALRGIRRPCGRVHGSSSRT